MRTVAEPYIYLYRGHMAKINEADYPSVATKFAVHREGDANIWYCEAHTFVRLLIDGKPVCWHEVCVTCGQESHHPVHDVRAYGLIHPKP